MDWMPLVQEILTVCVVPLLGILVRYLVLFIQTKNEEIKDRTKNELIKKYMDMLEATITDCVIATNQTYTSVLKQQNAFTKEAQKEAFEKTYNAVMAILTDDAKEYLSSAYADLTIFITQRIEAEVNMNKEKAPSEQ